MKASILPYFEYATVGIREERKGQERSVLASTNTIWDWTTLVVPDVSRWFFLLWVF